ncbi:MAG: M13 family metallopeptidase [Acidobacteriia bacterium]|nr:M13 family metallopeptidase [Terriglobia bacterium]
MKTTRLLVLFFAGCFLLAARAQNASEGPKLQHFDPNQADRSLDPCQDFYKFACGKWFAANPIPADQVYWDTSGDLEKWNETVLRETMEKASANAPDRTPVQQKVGDFWAACIDEKAVNQAGNRDLAPELRRIDALHSKSELADELAHLHMTVPAAWEFGNNAARAPFFGFGSGQDLDNASLVVLFVDQGGMGLPGRDFYLKDDAKSSEIRSQYVSHVSKMLALSGEGIGQADNDAAMILTMETAMAKVAMDNVSRRDPKNLNNKMSLAQLQALTPSFAWKRYLDLVGAPAPDHYLVTSPEFFKGLEQILQQHPLEHWQAYLRWHLVHGSAPYLAKPFVDENFDFYAHTLVGAPEQLPRWRRCVRAADNYLGEALGQAYVERAFPPESKRQAVQLVHDVEAALDRDIDSLDWMTPDTRKQAQGKLHSIEDKIGYPDHWRDYSSVAITRDSYLNNVHAATAFEFHRQLAKVGKPVDRSEWGMTPPTINAYYDAQLNTINFPAGILQPPSFEPQADAAVNYGGIGAAIGHEITHGFDDEGRKFDANGNLHDWWTSQDAKAYEERGKCIADQYTQDVPEAGVKQDGRLTQGEDTADNGGTRIAFMALQARLQKDGIALDAKGADGWTARQRFFLSYANSWCTEARPEAIRTQVLTNPHSFPRYRVNNVVSDMPEFQQAFGCKKGTPMVRENACRVW